VVYQTPEPIRPEPFPRWRDREAWHAFVEKLQRQRGGR
jgi:hypothetical protein